MLKNEEEKPPGSFIKKVPASKLKVILTLNYEKKGKFKGQNDPALVSPKTKTKLFPKSNSTLSTPVNAQKANLIPHTSGHREFM